MRRQTGGSGRHGAGREGGGVQACMQEEALMRRKGQAARGGWVGAACLARKVCWWIWAGQAARTAACRGHACPGRVHACMRHMRVHANSQWVGTLTPSPPRWRGCAARPGGFPCPSPLHHPLHCVVKDAARCCEPTRATATVQSLSLQLSWPRTPGHHPRIASGQRQQPTEAPVAHSFWNSMQTMAVRAGSSLASAEAILLLRSLSSPHKAVLEIRRGGV